MKKRSAWLFFGILMFILLSGVVLIFYFLSAPKNVNSKDTITIASWNLQIFGDTKEEKPDVMNKYADVMRNFDIVFVEEIRDIDGTAFKRLCEMLPDYNCTISTRAGRTNNKEQYGIIYLKDINLVYMHDFNPDFLDRWERPPVRATFEKNKYKWTVYDIHTKPEDTPREITKLEQLVLGELDSKTIQGNVMVLGDLNADCGYYTRSKDFMNWTWIIKDSDDTTTKNSDCAYDRIIMNKDFYAEYVDYGIIKNITPEYSDHYPVWVRVKDGENIVGSLVG